jgi:hypothetical protein
VKYWRAIYRGLDRLRTAAHKVNVAQSCRRIGDQPVGQLLGHVGREEARMGIGKLVDLRVQGRIDCRMAVTEARHRRATRSVEVALAGRIDELDALTARGDGQQ